MMYTVLTGMGSCFCVLRVLYIKQPEHKKKIALAISGSI